jgi:biopolymer transport protein ExbD
MGGSASKKGGLRPLPKKPKIDQVRNEINVTPLVDVCLVLLIIFMVITPLMARGKDVPLPETELHSEEKDKLQPVVSIGKDTKTGEIKVWLAGTSAQGKQELFEIGRLDEFQMSQDGEQTIMDSEARDKLAKEVQRLWDVSKNPESKGRLFMKVGADIPYEQVYPVLMAVNEDLALTSIDLGTADKRGGK